MSLLNKIYLYCYSSYNTQLYLKYTTVLLLSYNIQLFVLSTLLEILYNMYKN